LYYKSDIFPLCKHIKYSLYIYIYIYIYEFSSVVMMVVVIVVTYFALGYSA